MDDDNTSQPLQGAEPSIGDSPLPSSPPAFPTDNSVQTPTETNSGILQLHSVPRPPLFAATSPEPFPLRPAGPPVPPEEFLPPQPPSGAPPDAPPDALKERPPIVPPSSRFEPEKRRSIPVVGIVIAIILLLALAGFIVFQMRQKLQPASEGNQSGSAASSELIPTATPASSVENNQSVIVAPTASAGKTELSPVPTHRVTPTKGPIPTATEHALPASGIVSYTIGLVAAGISSIVFGLLFFL